MDFRLSVIPLDRVEIAQRISRESFEEQQDFNTNGHSLHSIQLVLPSHEHLPPDPIQPWVLLGPWLDLVLESQGLSMSDVHKIELPRSFLTTMSPISYLAFFKGYLSGDPDDLQFLADSFPRTTTDGVGVEQLLEEGKYFARLDTCSLKDAMVGSGPVKDIDDLWKRLATSMRASAGVQALRAASDQPLYLYLLRWNEKMSSKLEYRVFCAPGNGKITAISQYGWFDKWYHSGETQERRNEIAKRVFENAKIIHQRIMHHSAMTEGLRKRGFVFDILEDPDDNNATCLIELNDFGAMSGCGSCLFHWIEDAKLLYGLEEAVTFRVTI